MQKNILVESLTVESFLPFGRVIQLQQREPDKLGDGWKCWVPVGLLEVGSQKLQIGLVELQQQELIVTEMERHEDREEMLWAIDKPIVQLVGLPRGLNDSLAKPNVEETKAFLLKPGQIIIMNEGTWHAPSYALQGKTRYFYAIEKGNIPEKDVQPWVKFEDDFVVTMEVSRGMVNEQIVADE